VIKDDNVGILIAVIITILILIFFWKFLLIIAFVLVGGYLLLKIFRILYSKFNDYLGEKKLRSTPLKIDNFYYPLLRKIYSTCKFREGKCEGLKFIKNFAEEYYVDDCKLDNVEGTKVIIDFGKKIYSIPLSRVHFIVMFPKGFNWKDFLYLSSLSRISSVEEKFELLREKMLPSVTTFNKLRFVFELEDEKHNCWIYLVNEMRMENLELVDVGEDGILFYSFKEERLIYFPWKTIKAIGFSHSEHDMNICNTKEEVLKGFFLLYLNDNPAFLVKKDLIESENLLKTSNKLTKVSKETDERLKDDEDIW